MLSEVKRTAPRASRLTSNISVLFTLIHILFVSMWMHREVFNNARSTATNSTAKFLCPPKCACTRAYVDV